jgi:phage replication-related protein YjqB (UPF0714/DUF867 family)
VGSAFLNIVEGPDIDDAGEQVTFGAPSFVALGVPVPADFTTPGSRRQILIDVGDGAVMFTVAAVNGTEPDVQLGSAALTRLHLQTPPAASAHVTTNVLSSGELVETTMLRPGAQVAVVAPHGGFIERATGTQARRVSTDERLLANVWICRGRAGDAFRRYHITSDDLSEHSFPGLEALLATRHNHAVSFHGFDAHDGLDVIVGGRVDHTIKERVQQQLEPRLSSLLMRPAAVRLATSTSDPFPGLAPDNVVNRLAQSGGLQIEQAAVVRSTLGAPELIADVVIDVLTEQLWPPYQC